MSSIRHSQFQFDHQPRPTAGVESFLNILTISNILKKSHRFEKTHKNSISIEISLHRKWLLRVTIDRYHSVIVRAQGSVCRADDVGMNNPPEKISARLFKIITEASNDSVLIRYKHDNSLDIINSLAALDALENKMEVDVLISPAGPWATNILSEVTSEALEKDESTHAATLRSKAVKRANAEIERNEQRSNPFVIPPDVIGGGGLKRYEIRLWMHLIQQMIPLIP